MNHTNHTINTNIRLVYSKKTIQTIYPSLEGYGVYGFSIRVSKREKIKEKEL